MPKAIAKKAVVTAAPRPPAAACEYPEQISITGSITLTSASLLERVVQCSP